MLGHHKTVNGLQCVVYSKYPGVLGYEGTVYTKFGPHKSVWNGVGENQEDPEWDIEVEGAKDAKTD